MRTLKIVLLSLGLTACGAHQKEPVADLDVYRQNATQKVGQGHTKPTIVKEEVVVTKEKEVIIYRDRLTSNFVQINLPNESPVLTFLDTVNQTYEIEVTNLVDSIKTKMTLDGKVPKNIEFKLKSSEEKKSIYQLIYKGEALPVSTCSRLDSLTLKVQVTSGSEELKQQVQQLPIHLYIQKK